jgi:choice-of-anchor B domain-containing protein
VSVKMMSISGSRAALALAAVLALSIALARAHDEAPGAVETRLHGLVEGGALTEAQHQHVERLYAKGNLAQLDGWLQAQEGAGRLTSDTHLYLNALLGLSAPEATQAPVAADYTDNGNVTRLGRLDPQPPNPYYGDNSSTGTLYTGIWGYAVGAREYALQANSFGLHIIDVTTPSAPFRVQYIDMSGGVSPPKGRIWRDVDVNRDPISGKSYAYVGAQSNGNFWVVDLSSLSGLAPHGLDANPIPPAHIADRGRTNYGHTLFVDDDLDLLFLNSANNGSALGCQILDLYQNPFDPPIIASWSGSGRDCHDSVARGNVPGTGGKDLLYSAEGYATRYRLIDITNVRVGGAPTLLGESAPVSGTYAHSLWLDDSSHYLYTFEEFNVRDNSVYDISDPASPTLVTTFQYSGDATGNSRVHNGQVRGNYLLTAYYEAGFRVFDISNPANPVEVGKYETWRDPDGDGTFNKTITGVYNGAWDVHSFLPSGNVLVSDMKSGTFIVHVDPVPLPGPSSGLVATPGNGQVGLGWTAATGATGYTVHRATTSGGPYAIVKTNVVGTSFADTGLANGTHYFYVVTATNAEGEGAASNEASGTPVSPVTPTATTLVSSPNPSTLGQLVTFTATVTSGAGVPAGSVAFAEGATVWASGVTVDGTGRASFSTTALTAGSHILTATFTGAAGWGNSTGNNSAAPQVVNSAATTTLTFTSSAGQDGYVLESAETSGVGGSVNAGTNNTPSLRVGDDKSDRQYKSVVSFDTSAIPDGATIVSATLRLRRGAVSGTNPFTTHGTAWVDVQTGGLSGSTALQPSDFQVATTVVRGASLTNAASNGAWSEGVLTGAGALAVGKTGATQFRVSFEVDDNDDVRADYIGYYAGGNSTAANRPQLVVTYR